jgi:hypothetical protein
MIKLYFQKMLKKIKNRRKIIIKNIKIKDPLIGYAIDAII